MLDDVFFDSAQFLKSIGLASMVGKRVPTTGRPRHGDCTVDPVQRDRNDARRVSLERQFRKLKKVADLGGEGEFLIRAQRVRDRGFLSL